MLGQPDLPGSPGAQDALEQLRHAFGEVAPERPLFAAGLSAQVRRMLEEQFKASDFLKNYRVPDETLRALGIGAFDVTQTASLARP